MTLFSIATQVHQGPLAGRRISRNRSVQYSVQYDVAALRELGPLATLDDRPVPLGLDETPACRVPRFG
jgi:hypothetical protein